MYVPMVRHLVLLVSLAACADEQEFEFEATFDVEGSEVIVDGVSNPDTLTFSFASYERARADLVLHVTLVTGIGIGDAEIRPGHCADRVVPTHELGTVLAEQGTYAVIDGSTPVLYLRSYECTGTKLKITSQP